MLNKLAKLREERAEGDNGFTLIELLVVVVIIGVLVAIAIPLYLNYRTGAQNRSAQSDVRNAVSAMEQCIGDSNGKVPAAGVADAKSSIGLACGASPTATKDATGAQQTINISSGVDLSLTVDTTKNTYSLIGYYGTAGDGHSKYTYTSADGKTATQAS